ncbi:unnamed protein product [Phytophthora lilii]|uniref:Unnamed protein product n=1 Tax=Phytophthora lilii TaxID=2077276 RepID=A0A9W6TXL1_9STRA|nr:unnamed protein product [Phytophthora lilii]
MQWTWRSSVDVEELSLVELLEVEDDSCANSLPSTAGTRRTLAQRSVPGAQAYINWLLVSVRKIAEKTQIRLTPGLTSHSFRRGAAMHANDGSLAENWIIERGGWQLDRVNKVFGYMLGTTQADQRVARVLSGWSPKAGAHLPTLQALDQPVLARAHQLQALLFSSSLLFADPA